MFNKVTTLAVAVLSAFGALVIPGFGAELVDDNGVPLVKHTRAFEN